MNERQWHLDWAEREGSIEELDERYHDHLPFGSNCSSCGVEHAAINPEGRLVPAWAQARADKGLCANVEGWCITHGVEDDMGHYFASRPAHTVLGIATNH